jgi:3-deoxy-D-manno-octulosonate 8-phosphate phosphatase (KDO 8-P phosphatase)
MDYLYLGRDKKLDAFRELQKDLNLEPEDFCFIGDDLPDIPVLKQVGFAVAVKNASAMTRKVAHYVTEKDGGEGAVREVVEIILRAQEKLDWAIDKLWQ